MSQGKPKRTFINRLVDLTPLELHIPGYQYCGPGTKLNKRLARGDPGINELDRACKEHDIAYSEHADKVGRRVADKKLVHSAWKRVLSSDSRFGEKLAALGVATIMGAKMKFGGRLRSSARLKKKRMMRNKKKKLCFRKLVQNVKKTIKGNKNVSNSTIMAAVKTAKNLRRNQNISIPRVIPIPKTGGVLPLIPIFAGLSALGALSGGVTNIIKSIYDIRNAKQDLAEKIRHNKQMEGVAIGTKGSGVFLKPYKRGLGLYLKPYSKN